MKAREYAAEYYAADNKGEALVDIANKFVREFGQLAQSRNITRVESAVSLFKEHENKWVKFIELIDQPIRKDGCVYAGELMSEKLSRAHCRVPSHGLNCEVADEKLDKQREQQSKIRRKRFKKDIDDGLEENDDSVY